MDKKDLNTKIQEEVKKDGKVSYETLSQIAATLESERNAALQQLKKVTEERDTLKNQETFLYMDWMWRIITDTLSDQYLSKEFKQKCADKLQEMFVFDTPTEEKVETEE